jgi:[ribosomal protein S5]-alanine N-acetyltransferase
VANDAAGPPTLTSRRVTLRAPRVDDADALFATLTSDPAVTRYLSWTPHPDVGETRRVITELFNTGGDPTWVIEARDTGEPIGTCGWLRPRPHIVELGYCLGRRWWRRGIMSEVVALLIEQAGRDPTVYRVSAYCHVDNTGSAGVLRRCGLTLEGRLARYAVFPNLGSEPQDCLMYGKAVR